MQARSLSKGKCVPLILTAALLLPAGCSPTVATFEGEEEASQTAQGGGEDAAKNEQGANPLQRENFGLPSNPAQMGSLEPEEITRILSEYPPEEQTTIILRFLSFTLLFFYAVYQRYPTAEEGLGILLAPPPAPDGRKIDALAREILLSDSWGRRMAYAPTTIEGGLPFFSLRSLGPDGLESADDIVPDVEEVCKETSQRIAAGELDRME